MTFTISTVTKTIIRLVGGAGVAALLTIAYTMWHDSDAKSAAYGENKALLRITTKQLEESKDDIQKLKNEKADLQTVIDGLRQDLLSEQLDNRYNKKLLNEANAKTSQLETNVAKLVALVRTSDPCAPLREEIRELEEQLQTPDWDGRKLNPRQTEQARSSLDKKYTSLDTCLSRN